MSERSAFSWTDRLARKQAYILPDWRVATAPMREIGGSLLPPIEAVPRTPWLGYGIQPVSGPLTPCTEGKTGLQSTNPKYGRHPLTPDASPAGACSVP